MKELVRAKVLPEDYDYADHRELISMQPGDVPVTYADSKALKKDLLFPTFRQHMGRLTKVYGAV